jgi:hypothetical protein
MCRGRGLAAVQEIESSSRGGQALRDILFDKPTQPELRRPPEDRPARHLIWPLWGDSATVLYRRTYEVILLT